MTKNLIFCKDVCSKGRVFQVWYTSGSRHSLEASHDGHRFLILKGRLNRLVVC